MTTFKCTLSINAGVSIEWHDQKILIDAFPKDESSMYSTLSLDLWSKIMENDAFKNPDMLLYTHCHADHFSQELTSEFMKIYPKTELYLPDERYGKQKRVTDGMCFTCGSIQGMVIQLTHENKMYADCPHFGYILTDSEKIVLVTGDCAIANPQLLKKIAGYRPDIAILDFPWITTSKGREFLEKRLRPKCAIINHFPIMEEDTLGFKSAFNQAKQYVECFRVFALQQPFDTIELSW